MGEFVSHKVVKILQFHGICVSFIKVWRIAERKLSPVPEDSYGFFFAGDSYVILYKYILKGKENYIIYFWQVK